MEFQTPSFVGKYSNATEKIRSSNKILQVLDLDKHFLLSPQVRLWLVSGTLRPEKLKPQVGPILDQVSFLFFLILSLNSPAMFSLHPFDYQLPLESHKEQSFFLTGHLHRE
jgi:hypothetical protein